MAVDPAEVGAFVADALDDLADDYGEEAELVDVALVLEVRDAADPKRSLVGLRHRAGVRQEPRAYTLGVGLLQRAVDAMLNGTPVDDDED